MTCRYPKNPVLRLLTPRDTVRNMTVYPVKLESEAILVNIGSSSSEIPNIRGGANTSSAGNNIYALQPQTYVQGSTAGSGMTNVLVALHCALVGAHSVILLVQVCRSLYLPFGVILTLCCCQWNFRISSSAQNAETRSACRVAAWCNDSFLACLAETSPSGAPDKLDGFTVGVALFGFSVTAITGTTISLLNKVRLTTHRCDFLMVATL